MVSRWSGSDEPLDFQGMETNGFGMGRLCLFGVGGSAYLDECEARRWGAKGGLVDVRDSLNFRFDRDVWSSERFSIWALCLYRSDGGKDWRNPALGHPGLLANFSFQRLRHHFHNLLGSKKERDNFDSSYGYGCHFSRFESRTLRRAYDAILDLGNERFGVLRSSLDELFGMVHDCDGTDRRAESNIRFFLLANIDRLDQLDAFRIHSVFLRIDEYAIGTGFTRRRGIGSNLLLIAGAYRMS